jgi:tetratricopeptide (TPR) repeat protein
LSPESLSIASATPRTLEDGADLLISLGGERPRACIFAFSQKENIQITSGPPPYCVRVVPFQCGIDFWCWSNAKDAARFASAVARLGQFSDRAVEFNFARIAQRYRESKSKPKLPEQARRLAVQADEAARKGQDQDAILLYRQALDVAPLSPFAHYNLAFLLADEGDFGGAADEMKKYLMLVPNAANAETIRNGPTVQQRIWIWEHRSQSSQ